MARTNDRLWEIQWDFGFGVASSTFQIRATNPFCAGAIIHEIWHERFDMDMLTKVTITEVK